MEAHLYRTLRSTDGGYAKNIAADYLDWLHLLRYSFVQRSHAVQHYRQADHLPVAAYEES
ncbi:hypothetical protein D3C78_1630910 [compost metagenome]